MKDVKQIIEEIERQDKNKIVNFSSLKYGTIWIGKIKYLFGAITFEALNEKVEKVVTNNDSSITIYVQ